MGGTANLTHILSTGPGNDRARISFHFNAPLSDPELQGIAEELERRGASRLKVTRPNHIGFFLDMSNAESVGQYAEGLGLELKFTTDAIRR